MLRERGLERPEIRARTVVAVVAAFLAFAAAMLGGLDVYYRTQMVGRAPAAPTTFPAPRLQVDPSVDLGRARDRDARQLSTYGWVDREAGIVRIPIDRAMKAVAARGAAGFDPADGPAVVPDPARTTPQGRNTGVLVR